MTVILFNKPCGVLSQFTDSGAGRSTLKDFIPVPGVYAAGRLDRDSEGLLLLTDDGWLINRLTSPRSHIVKTYYVLVEGDVTLEKLTRLSNGIQLKDYVARPAHFRLMPDPNLPPRPKPVTPHGPTAWLEVKLREGKKHQIRHMTAAVGLFTLRIFRAAIGPVTAAGLRSGKWRTLTKRELKSLSEQV